MQGEIEAEVVVEWQATDKTGLFKQTIQACQQAQSPCLVHPKRML